MNRISSRWDVASHQPQRRVHFGGEEIRTFNEDSWIPQRQDDPHMAAIIERRVRREESVSSNETSSPKSILKEPHPQKYKAKMINACCVIS